MIEVGALAAALTDVSAVRVPASAFAPRAVPAHLVMNIVVADADGTVHDADDDLGTIKRRLAATTREAIEAYRTASAGRPLREKLFET